MLKLWISFQNRVAELREEEGQAMAEYGLIIALVAIFLIVALGVFSGALDGVFREISANL